MINCYVSLLFPSDPDQMAVDQLWQIRSTGGAEKIVPAKPADRFGVARVHKERW